MNQRFFSVRTRAGLAALSVLPMACASTASDNDAEQASTPAVPAAQVVATDSGATCPVTGMTGDAKPTEARAELVSVDYDNEDWWPNQLDLTVLHALSLIHI